MVNPPLKPQYVETLNTFLGQAEKRVASRMKADENHRLEFLQFVSKQSGLPLR
jgi:hypothetical protein